MYRNGCPWQRIYFIYVQTYKHANMSTHSTTVQAYNHAKMQTCKLANSQTYKRTTSKHASKKNTNVQTFKHTNVHTLHYNRRQYATLHYTTLPHLTLHYLTSLYILSSVLIISVEYFFQRTQPEKKEHKEPLNCPCPCSFPSDNKQRHGREENGLGVPEMRMRQSPP